MKQFENYKSIQYIKKTPKLRKVAWVFGVAFVVSVLALMFVPWQQSIFGVGKVIALSPTDREQSIFAPIDGRLEEWHVQEGTHVEKGDLLVEIANIDPGFIKRLKMEEDASKLRVQAAELGVSTSKKNVDRNKQLLEKGLSASRVYEESQLEYLKYLQELAQAQAQLAKIQVTINQQNSRQVKAPRAGTIISRMPGDDSVFVKPGDVLAVLVPDTNSRAVELWVNGNDAPLIHVGDEARLQFEGWPAIQFSGWPAVAIGTFKGRVTFVSPQGNEYGLFKLLIIPEKQIDWPEPKYLRQGVLAKGWVLLKEVRLGYELWRRYNGFPPNLNSAELELKSKQVEIKAVAN
ncbi:HlyD family efflux transporter periplasmic adaptor subunit [Francisellaceae bacterium]|nr:HlyD family efflux transporter periplasmic adaptor subunit [Francisellaceae bacterium]